MFATVVSVLVSITYPAARLPPNEASDDAVVQQLCVKGRFFLGRRTPEALESSIKDFEEATRLAPRHAPAYAGLTAAYVAFAGNSFRRPASEDIPHARRAALVARQLAPANVECWS